LRLRKDSEGIFLLLALMVKKNTYLKINKITMIKQLNLYQYLIFILLLVACFDPLNLELDVGTNKIAESDLIFGTSKLDSLTKTEELNTINMYGSSTLSKDNIIEIGFLYTTAREDLLRITDVNDLGDTVEKDWNVGKFEDTGNGFSFKLEKELPIDLIGETIYAITYAIYKGLDNQERQVQRRFVESNISEILLTDGWYRPVFNPAGINIDDRKGALAFVNPSKDKCVIIDGCLNDCFTSSKNPPTLVFDINNQPFPQFNECFKEGASFNLFNREGAAGFWIEDKIYFGLGFLEEGVPCKEPFDFYSFPASNCFSNDSNVPDSIPLNENFTSRFGAIAFTLDGFGYIGMGKTLCNGEIEDLKDFWRFDPNAESPSTQWTELTLKMKSGMIGELCSCDIGFAIDGKTAIIGGGRGDNRYCGEFWRFEPQENNDVVMLSSMGNLDVQNGIAKGLGFCINDDIYVGLGAENYNQNFFRFNNESSIPFWEPVQRFPNVSIVDGIGFSIGEEGYVITGVKTSDLNVGLKELWVYKPK